MHEEHVVELPTRRGLGLKGLVFHRVILAKVAKQNLDRVIGRRALDLVRWELPGLGYKVSAVKWKVRRAETNAYSVFVQCQVGFQMIDSSGTTALCSSEECLRM